jgi:hypothetical protein
METGNFWRDGKKKNKGDYPLNTSIGKNQKRTRAKTPSRKGKKEEIISYSRRRHRLRDAPGFR